MNRDKTYALQKAKDNSFLLLKFRPRSEKEIRQRLKQKNFSDSVIKETLDFLRGHRFVDDAGFAKAWIEYRLKKPLGIRKIKQELKIKGIAGEIIEEALSEALKDYSQEEVVSRLVQERLRRLKGVEPAKAKRRVFAWLLRRGFSPQVIIETLGQR